MAQKLDGVRGMGVVQGLDVVGMQNEDEVAHDWARVGRDVDQAETLGAVMSGGVEMSGDVEVSDYVETLLDDVEKLHDFAEIEEVVEK
nr:hypothetical protein BaRGS_002189 [Batillaria attramentaria]